MFTIPDNNWNFMNQERYKKLKKIYENMEEFYPAEDKVLRFLETDFTKLQYIILGMEPYPTAYEKDGILIPEATGRSFEVSSMKDKTWISKFKQSSLRNLLKTVYLNDTGEKKSLSQIREEIQNGQFFIENPAEWFDTMERQGVLFLNASLTVEPNHVGSHSKLWEDFMKDLILHINKNSKAHWLLWGNTAIERISGLVEERCCIKTCHPRLARFVDENCFQYTKNINWVGI